MNNETITIQDCLDMYEKKNRVAIIEMVKLLHSEGRIE